MSLRRPPPVPHSRGFTLVEMVVVIVITSIIGGMIAMFIGMPVNAYFDTERRARLTELADTALRRISRDLRAALPNSVRVTAVGGTTYLEFIPTVGGGRYRNYPASGAVPGNPLDFSVADAAFDVIGPVPVYAAGNSVVVYNLNSSPLIPENNAYSGSNRAAVTSANAAPALFSTDAAPHTITLAAMLFPAASPSSLFQMVTPPVTYACTPGAAGTLLRYEGYAFAAAQPTPPAVAPAVVANGVSACTIAYDPLAQRVRTALITLSLSLTEAGETATIVHQMHVLNTP